MAPLKRLVFFTISLFFLSLGAFSQTRKAVVLAKPQKKSVPVKKPAVAGYPKARISAVGDTIKYTTPLRFCAGGSVTLTANNAASGATFQWTKDNAAITGETAVAYKATTTGNYSVVVKEGSNTINYDTVRVTVFSKPVVNFTFTNDSVCSGTAIAFTSTVSSGTAPFKYEWRFADGTKASTANVNNKVFTILGCGTFTGSNTLIVTDANGCSDSVTKPIKVIRAPEVAVSDVNVFSPFSNCENSPTVANPNYKLKITNSSPDASCIVSYSINWGDGVIQNGLTAASFPLEHTYTKLGAFNLVVTARGTNGCSNSKTYLVANQSNPAGGLGTLGSTTGLCAPATIPFIISNWQDNSPGTSYVLNFGDGDSVVLNHPLNVALVPDTVYHTYKTSSCPVPTFTAVLKVINACDITPYTAGNIQIRIKPVAAFDSIAPVCVGQNVCFANTTILGNYGANCNTFTQFSWNFGDPSSGGNNTSTAENPCHVFSAPGVYTITLTATNPCGTTTATRQVCVVEKPVPSFTIDKSSGCLPLTVKTTNTSNVITSCAPAKYEWAVSYTGDYCGNSSSWSFASGNASSLAPEFIFSNAGRYTITLSITNACGTFSTSKNVDVKRPPTVSIAAISDACGPVSITPSALVTNCGSGALTYAWTFSGGTPATSNAANPGTVSFVGNGTHTVKLSVTNECGTTTVSRDFLISPLPDLTTPANDTVCNGTKAGPYTFNSTTSGAIISWTSSNAAIGLATSGSGNIQSFNAVNSTASTISSVIKVVATQGGCKTENSFVIAVNPSPASPVVISPVQYCLEESAVPLSATLTGKQLNWYTLPSGGTASLVAPTPSTTSIGTTSYYVSQTSASGCEGPRSTINVIVNPIPLITGVISQPSICGASNGFITIKGLTPQKPYTVKYEKNGTPVSLLLTTNAAGEINIGSLSAGTYSDITATANGCPSNKLGPFILSDPNPPPTPVASANGPICSGADINLKAAGSSGSYLWTGPAGFTSTAQNPVIASAGVSRAGTYFVTATVNGCTSPAGSVTVVVNQTPSNPVVTVNSPLCEGDTLQLKAAASPPGLSYSWTGPNNFSSSEQNPVVNTVTQASAGKYIVTVANISGGCTNTAEKEVEIKPTPKITNAVAQQPINCASATGSITLSGLSVSRNYAVTYSRNGTSVSKNITSGADGKLTIVDLSAGLYENIFVVLDGCPSNTVGPFTLTDPNPPTAPVATSNGPVCSGGVLQLSASGNDPSATYLWSGPNGFSRAEKNPQITNAGVGASGTYTVSTTINGCTSPLGTVDVVVNPTPVKPVASSNAPLCDGAALNLQVTSSGAGILSYEWTGPNGFVSTDKDPSITNVQENASGLYIVKVTGEKGGCFSIDTTNVVINKTPVISSVVKKDPLNCASSTGSISLSGLVVGGIYKVSYLKNGSPESAEITASAGGVVTIDNLPAGTYSDINVSINNCISPVVGPLVLTDPNPPAAPIVSSNGPVCSGQLLQLNATAIGTNITYAWTGPNNFTSAEQSPQIINAGSINAGDYFVTVTINNCTSIPGLTTVVVNPLPAAPAVNTPVEYCIGVTAVQLSAVATNSSTLNWYSSATGGIGSTIAPTPSTGVTGVQQFFVSQTTLNGCEGPRAAIEVVTRPDAGASFTYPVDTACIPFLLNISNTSPAVINSNYQWFADDSLIGSGRNFPGYTLVAPDDSVNIKMIAFSTYGCKPDSVEHRFYTKPVPVANFTMSDSAGCGPLSINIINTTAELNRFNYIWDFGNGQTSTLAQPGVIVFAADPDFGDTVYTVVLKAFAGCDTVYIKKNVLVKSKPKSLFTPDKSFGCSPMTVVFNNISKGLATDFLWDFGDGQTKQMSTADTVSHVYFSGIKDTFFATLISKNTCGTDTLKYAIAIAPNTIKIDMAVNGNELSGCLPHTVNFINNSRGGSSFRWNFGDGSVLNTTKNIDTVRHTYTMPGVYNVSLNASNGCSDTSTIETIKVFSIAQASFNINTKRFCNGDSVAFINSSDSATSYLWDFGDGTSSFIKNPVHFYANPGIYKVVLKTFIQNQDGFICSDADSSNITVTQQLPEAQLLYNGGYICSSGNTRFEIRGNNIDSLIWNFGDGTILRTKSPIVFHQFNLPGIYVPVVNVVSSTGCSILLKGSDTLKVDKVTAGFSFSEERYCGYTVIDFKDSSEVFLRKGNVRWNFGDGTEGTGFAVKHTYNIAGNYTVQMITTAESGCADTLQRVVTVGVNNIPVADISSDPSGCTRQSFLFDAVVQSADSISSYRWTSSININGNEQSFSFVPLVPGNHSVQLIVGTYRGCFDTVVKQLPVYATPLLAQMADRTICAGTSTRLTTSGATRYSWEPATGLSCTDCANPIATPQSTTNYRVKGFGAEGCFSEDTVLVKVIPPFTLKSSGNDTLCIGESVALNVSGASTYTWTPAIGLSSTTIPNPIANPSVTTRYRVIGRDENSCFADTAFIEIAVGNYSTISLGPDLTLPTGTEQVLTSVVTNGPVKTWQWSPSTNLSCNYCPAPVATIKNDITYVVNIQNIYGCAASDTLSFKTFCENAQVFIPNAFTPDGDGVNDKLIVRAKGIARVKFFRVFNRWGDLVFERNNFTPNDINNSWDGKVRGVIGGPEVFVYTAEVICDNGATYVYKGNVSIIK
jgi:PKD repeat protein